MASHANSTPAPAPNTPTLPLSPTARAAIIERLHEEFGLLCLGIPSAWRIEQAIAQAEGALA